MEKEKSLQGTVETKKNLNKKIDWSNFQKYLSIILIEALLLLILYFLLSQEYFRPKQDDLNYNYFSIGIFLLLAFFIFLGFLKIIQFLLFDFFLEKKQGERWNTIKNRISSPTTALFFSVIFCLLLFLKIIGILDLLIFAVLFLLIVIIYIIF